MAAKLKGNARGVVKFMEHLQKAFQWEMSHGLIATLITEMIARKLESQGVTLSQRQKNSIRKQIASGDYESIRVRPWPPWKSAVVTVTHKDLDDLERTLEGIAEDMTSIVQSISDDLTDSVLQKLKKDWPSEFRRQSLLQRKFVRRMNRHWGRALSLLDMLLTIARELGESINKRLRKQGTGSPYLVDVQTRLHARACQVASEIIVLLRHGFSDGAMARWRTLHEIAVVSLFIAKGGEQLAERYALHRVVESLKAARDYQSYANRLGYEPLTQMEINALEEQNEALKARFGPSFVRDNGWASEALGMESPKFRDIERGAGIDHLRPFYRMASHNVHAVPKGVFFRLGLTEESNLLLAGASNYGLADPGQNTAISLVQVTSSLASLDITLDTIVGLKILSRLSDEVAEYFVSLQKDIRN